MHLLVRVLTHVELDLLVGARGRHGGSVTPTEEIVGCPLFLL